ncbi:MAG: rod shape-determining protein MreD [Bryobacteraceae bacterium]|nr:rod shape-determining protein MreD [Bryobacteraceae bacterium]
MNDYREELLTRPLRSRGFRFAAVSWIGLPLIAILFQVYVPRFFQSLSYLELPLTVTVYFSLMRRSAIMGLLFGAAVGLAQDSLSHQPLGMFGIVKTLVGYFAASVSLRFDVDSSVVRFFLALFFFVFHQFFYWVMTRALLGQAVDFDWQQTAVLAVLNAIVAVPLFRVFDKLRVTTL